MDDNKRIKLKEVTSTELIEFLNQLGEAASKTWDGLSEDEEVLLDTIKTLIGKFGFMAEEIKMHMAVGFLLVEYTRSIGKEEEAKSYVERNIAKKKREMSELLKGQGTEVAKA